MDLPRITAILPARSEPESVLRRSLLSLISLDYPVEKKEILLVTDSDDVNTGMISDRLSRELGVMHVVVPKNSDPTWNVLIRQARERGAKWADIEVEQLPYSKPRALTYALPMASGEIVTVVDAEDVQGDPLVFRKAAQCLRTNGFDAVQGRLRFINYRNSWLSLQSVGERFPTQTAVWNRFSYVLLSARFLRSFSLNSRLPADDTIFASRYSFANSVSLRNFVAHFSPFRCGQPLACRPQYFQHASIVVAHLTHSSGNCRNGWQNGHWKGGEIHYCGLAVSTIMFYWILWGLPVLRALWQMLRGARFWEKTLHEGLHHPVLDRF